MVLVQNLQVFHGSHFVHVGKRYVYVWKDGVVVVYDHQLHPVDQWSSAPPTTDFSSSQAR